MKDLNLASKEEIAEMNRQLSEGRRRSGMFPCPGCNPDDKYGANAAGCANCRFTGWCTPKPESKRIELLPRHVPITTENSEFCYKTEFWHCAPGCTVPKEPQRKADPQRLFEAARVMRGRAEQCRRMAHTYAASMFHGEALVQRSRAEAYEAAAITLEEMAEGRA